MAKLKANFDSSLKELRDHISKLEARFGFKFPYAEPKTQIHPRKLYIPVRDDEEEELLSEPEPEPEPDPEPEAPACVAVHSDADDSQDEAPLLIDEGQDKPLGKSRKQGPAAESPQITSHEQTVLSTAASDTNYKNSAPAESPNASSPGDKSEVPKSVPVQRSKIAQNLKKTLQQSRRSLSIGNSESEEPAAVQPVCAADGVTIARLRAEVVSLKRELEAERRNHMKAMDSEKRRQQAVIAELQREKDEALVRATQSLNKEHEAMLRTVKCKQWCIQCGNVAQYYCCWNTSYCSHQCQSFHWEQHMSTCQNLHQQRQQSGPGPAVS